MGPLRIALLATLCACQTTEAPSAGLGGTTSALGGRGSDPRPPAGDAELCDYVCIQSGVLCGTVPDGPSTCCCVEGCPEWRLDCVKGVEEGTIGPGESNVGDGVFTAKCEAACNAAEMYCGTVRAPDGDECCCIGACPENAQACLASVAVGERHARGDAILAAP